MKSVSAMAAVAVLMTAVGTQAQLLDYPALSQETNSQPDIHASIGLTLPLGGRRGVAHAPRMEVSVIRDRVDSQGGRLSQSVQFRDQGRARLGIALEPEHRIWFNGEAVSQDGSRHNISALGGIAIGIGAILLIGAVAVSADPPLNDLFEPRN